MFHVEQWLRDEGENYQGVGGGIERGGENCWDFLSGLEFGDWGAEISWGFEGGVEITDASLCEVSVVRSWVEEV